MENHSPLCKTQLFKKKNYHQILKYQLFISRLFREGNRFNISSKLLFRSNIVHWLFDNLIKMNIRGARGIFLQAKTEEIRVYSSMSRRYETALD